MLYKPHSCFWVGAKPAVVLNNSKTKKNICPSVLVVKSIICLALFLYPSNFVHMQQIVQDCKCWHSVLGLGLGLVNPKKFLVND
jgi:hypothetical protein